MVEITREALVAFLQKHSYDAFTDAREGTREYQAFLTGAYREWLADALLTFLSPPQEKGALVRIEVCEGEEQHTSNGAKGYVFVWDGMQDVFISKAEPATLIDEAPWTDLGTHGKWVTSTYEVPEGTILKLLAISTWRRTPSGGGEVYLVADSSAARVHVTGEGYHGRAGSITGALRVLRLQDLPERGIKIDPKHRKYFKEGLITVKEVGDAD